PRNIETADNFALKINGYEEDPQSYTGDIEQIMREYSEVVDGCMIAGQNIQFDVNFIEKYYKEFNIKEGVHRHRKLEVSSMAWPVVRLREIRTLSLEDQCKCLGISNDGAHRALTDCRRTLEVYRC